MKKQIIILLVFLSLIISCEKNKVQAKKTKTTIEKKDINETKEKIDPLTNNWLKNIELDMGNKWKANNETTTGVNNMLSLVLESNPKTIENYRELAKKLNEEKNTLVKKCTMKGPSHDNLHVFLHPLIEKIDALLKVNSLDEASKLKQIIKENLEAYQNYFY